MILRNAQALNSFLVVIKWTVVYVRTGLTGGEAQSQAPTQTAAAGQSQQQARAGVSQEPSEAVPQPVAESLPPGSSVNQGAPSDVSRQPEISFRQALAEQEAAKSEVSSSQAALGLAPSQDPGSTAPAEGFSATMPSGGPEDPSSHADSVSSLGSSLRPQSDAAAAAASTSGRQSSTGRRAGRRAWPVVNRRRGQESNGILVDQYSTVVSDSDTSEEEDAHQSAPLLGSINAASIQSGQWRLLRVENVYAIVDMIGLQHL